MDEENPLLRFVGLLEFELPCLWLDAVFPFRFSVFRDARTGIYARTARDEDPVRKT